MLLLALTAAALAADPPIAGRWRSPGGNSIIAIAPCGSAWCGTVTWASDRAKRDAQRTTPQLIGTQVLSGLSERKPGRWHGKLFIPDKAMRVTARIQMLDDDRLKVSGCAVICHAQVWTRAQKD